MSQHRHRLDHQEKPVNGKEKYLDGTRIDVVLLQLVKREIAEQNQPGDVDEEEHEEC